MEEAISKKPLSSFSDDELSRIRSITVDKKSWALEGSYSFRGVKYPSDIDVLDVIRGCCTLDNVVNKFTKNIQKIVLETAKPNTWLIEFKAGVDERYFDKTIDQLHAQSLITDDDYKILVDLSNNNDLVSVAKIEKKLREYYVIRWTKDQVLLGQKQLRAGKTITLNEAVKSSDAINMEFISVIDDKIKDISNFFILVLTTSNGVTYAINTPQESIDNFPEYFRKELIKEIDKQYHNILDTNYLKLAKRFLSYGIYFEDHALIEKVLPLINSPIGLASQIKSELSTLKKLVEHVKREELPVRVMKNQLNEIKQNLPTILEISNEDLLSLNKMLDEAIHELKRISELSLSNFILVIDLIVSFLKDLINTNSSNYLKKVSLIPLPSNFERNRYW